MDMNNCLYFVILIQEINFIMYFNITITIITIKTIIIIKNYIIIYFVIFKLK